MELYNITDSANIAFTQFKAPPPVKSVEITNLTQDEINTISLFGIFPVGTKTEDALMRKGVIAVNDYTFESSDSVQYELWGVQAQELWTGSGTFDVYIAFDSGSGIEYYVKEDVVFAADEEIASVDKAAFTFIDLGEVELGDPTKVTITGLSSTDYMVSLYVIGTDGMFEVSGAVAVSNETAVLELFAADEIPWSGTGNYYLQLNVSGISHWFTNGGKLLFEPQSIEDIAASGIKPYSLKAENTIEFAKFARVPQPNQLIIHDISAEFSNLAQDGVYVGVFPQGTTLAQAKAGVNLVAEAVSNNISGDFSSYISARLFMSNGSSWEGTGTYDVYLFLGSGSEIQYYQALNVAISNDSPTELVGSDFTRIDE
jgi:hypothetical protein